MESRGGEAAVHELDAFLERAGIEWSPVTTEQVKAARVAWRRFGKGNHPARLNLGDCFLSRFDEGEVVDADMVVHHGD